MPRKTEYHAFTHWLRDLRNKTVSPMSLRRSSDQKEIEQMRLLMEARAEVIQAVIRRFHYALICPTVSELHNELEASPTQIELRSLIPAEPALEANLLLQRIRMAGPGNTEIVRRLMLPHEFRALEAQRQFVNRLLDEGVGQGRRVRKPYEPWPLSVPAYNGAGADVVTGHPVAWAIVERPLSEDTNSTIRRIGRLNQRMYTHKVDDTRWPAIEQAALAGEGVDKYTIGLRVEFVHRRKLQTELLALMREAQLAIYEYGRTGRGPDDIPGAAEHWVNVLTPTQRQHYRALLVQIAEADKVSVEGMAQHNVYGKPIDMEKEERRLKARLSAIKYRQEQRQQRRHDKARARGAVSKQAWDKAMQGSRYPTHEGSILEKAQKRANEREAAERAWRAKATAYSSDPACVYVRRAQPDGTDKYEFVELENLREEDKPLVCLLEPEQREQMQQEQTQTEQTVSTPEAEQQTPAVTPANIWAELFAKHDRKKEGT